MYNYQDSMQASHKIGMAIVGLVLFTSMKSVAVILYISITWAYKKFRSWIHKTFDKEKWVKISTKKEEEIKSEMTIIQVKEPVPKISVTSSPFTTSPYKTDPAIRKVILKKNGSSPIGRPLSMYKVQRPKSSFKK